MFTAKAVKNFWGKVDSSGSCWVWTACKNANGYGNLTIAQKRYLAHRASWIIHNGEIPEKTGVLHKCDNPPCVNPAHLFLGSQQDNLSDMVKKRRHKSHKGVNYMPSGEKHHHHFVGPRITREIAKQMRQDPRKQKDIAAHYGVDPSLVSLIKANKIWVE